MISREGRTDDNRFGVGAFAGTRSTCLLQDSGAESMFCGVMCQDKVMG